MLSEEERLQRIQQLLHSKIDEAREGDQQAMADDGAGFSPTLVDDDAHDVMMAELIQC